MMLFKLICKNVKKNFHDYLIYFITLMLAISLFYAFNSIESQRAFAALNSAKGLLANQLGKYISMLSDVIAVMLAFLMIYANQFLLKRRKRELGIYMTLGMDREKISCIFVAETFFIGLISLIVGIVVGLAISQVLSIISLKLFAINLSNYEVSFSIKAFDKTIVCFLIIYLIIMIFNVRVVSNVKLTDLMKANRKNQSLRIQDKKVSALLCFASIVLLMLAGFLVCRDGILPNSKSFNFVIIFMLIGTALFFYSISSLILEVIKSRKEIYLKGLNTFLFRQLGSKIETNFISMTVICLLLTVTICIVSTGMSVALTMNSIAKKAAPYDMTVYAEVNKTGNINLYKTLISKGILLDRYLQSHVEVTEYVSDLKYKDMLGKEDMHLWRRDAKLPWEKVSIVALSDFNKAMQCQGKKTVELNRSEVLLNCNYKGTKSIMSKFISENGSIKLKGIKLHAKDKKLTSETIWMSNIGDNDRGTIIVPDYLTKSLKKDCIILGGVYKKRTNSEAVVHALNPLAADLNSGFKYITKSIMYDAYYGIRASGAFLCCYIGFIFLIICVTILALQQLTETTDNIYRYGLLKKFGADKSSINKTLFQQVFVYFAAPLTLASIFSFVGILKVMELIEDFLNMSVKVNMIFTIIIFLVIYGGYFMATYCSSKKIISDLD